MRFISIQETNLSLTPVSTVCFICWRRVGIKSSKIEDMNLTSTCIQEANLQLMWGISLCFTYEKRFGPRIHDGLVFAVM